MSRIQTAVTECFHVNCFVSHQPYSSFKVSSSGRHMKQVVTHFKVDTRPCTSFQEPLYEITCKAKMVLACDCIGSSKLPLVVAMKHRSCPMRISGWSCFSCGIVLACCQSSLFSSAWPSRLWYPASTSHFRIPHCPHKNTGSRGGGDSPASHISHVSIWILCCCSVKLHSASSSCHVSTPVN